jgi:hypothetical protein
VNNPENTFAATVIVFGRWDDGAFRFPFSVFRFPFSVFRFPFSLFTAFLLVSRQNFDLNDPIHPIRRAMHHALLARETLKPATQTATRTQDEPLIFNFNFVVLPHKRRTRKGTVEQETETKTQLDPILYRRSILLRSL